MITRFKYNFCQILENFPKQEKCHKAVRRKEWDEQESQATVIFPPLIRSSSKLSSKFDKILKVFSKFTQREENIVL